MDYDSDSERLLKGAVPGSKRRRVPRWDAQKTTYDSWWYDMVPYLKTLGLWDTAMGTNRHWRLDASKSAEYEIRSSGAR